MAKNIIKALLTALILMSQGTIKAQQFDDFFLDKTLRLDYIFAGDNTEQSIYLDQMSVSARWYGKRQRLGEVPMEGNGQIIMRSKSQKEVIYRNSFSTLFQEWQSYDEAKSGVRRSFENVFLVPMPKDTVFVTVQLYNNRRQVKASYTQKVAPQDILIRQKGAVDRQPTETIQTAQDTTKCIHIAFVAEGYKESEMEQFVSAAKEATEAIFEHSPFKENRRKFNIIAVKCPSRDSGTSIPGKGLWLNTALGSSFDTFYMDRYLTTLNLKTLHDKLSALPYEHIIVLVNTDKYGGGGILNSYNLSMVRHRQFHPVVVHEFGHSFAGLADEYAYENEPIPMYPKDTEPWERNITTLRDFHGKWEQMIAPNTPCPTPLSDDMETKRTKVGLFEGAGYSLNGVYRGVEDCRMRVNDTPQFCPVCQKAIQDVIDFYTK